MPLKSFTVQRYRAFRERTTVELRPLTLLFGYNSSGKSALLRALPLLRDSLSGSSPLALHSEAIRGATFADLHCRLDPRPVISLELETDEATTRYEIRDLPDQRRQVLERIRRRHAGIDHVLEWTTHGSRYQFFDHDEPTGGLVPTQELDLDIDGLTILGGHFEGMDPRVPFLGPDGWGVPGADMLASTQWLDALRARVRRRTPFGSRPSGPLASDGRDAPTALAYARIDETPVYDTVRGFYRDRLGHELTVEPVGDDFRLLVTPVGDPSIKIDLVDTGEGLSQVLPVAVSLARATSTEGPSLLALEQPELHLHPRLHEQLARWICRSVRQGRGPRVVVETHSENVLLTVLLSLIEGELEPEDLVVYWVHQLADGQSLAERVTFDELARPQGLWPPDVFQEDAALASRLNRRRLENLGQ